METRTVRIEAWVEKLAVLHWSELHTHISAWMDFPPGPGTSVPMHRPARALNLGIHCLATKL